MWINKALSIQQDFASSKKNAERGATRRQVDLELINDSELKSTLSSSLQSTQRRDAWYANDAAKHIPSHH